jgi:hypothetical protein
MLSRWGGRVVVVVWLNIDGANPICYETIKVCDPLHFFHVQSIDVDEHIPAISWYSRRPSSAVTLPRWPQADNLHYLDTIHA